VKKTLVMILVGALGFGFFLDVAMADGDPAVAVSGGGFVSFPDPNGSVIGWEFTTALPQCISALGYYDSGFDGLNESHQVGLFDSLGNLVTSTTVTSSDPLENGFRYASIPSICLTLGETYIVAAHTSASSADLILQNPIVDPHPAITFVGGRIQTGVPFGFPGGTTSNTYFGPNVKIADDCLPGTVNDAVFPIADVLFVNGTSGIDGLRKVAVAEGGLIWCTILTPPAGGNGKFVIHANTGAPTAATLKALPGGVGIGCFPMILTAGGNPIAVWNNIGKTDLVGSSKYFDGSPIVNPPKAPAVFLQLSTGDPVNLPAGTTVTLQGIIVDPGSTSPKSASTTNGVILTIL